MLKTIRNSALIAAIFVLLITSIIMGGCDLITGEEACTETPEQEQQIYDINAQKALNFIQDNTGKPDFIIIDVRNPEEYAGGHLDGAFNIDFNSGDLLVQLEALDKEKTYLVYCRSGRRSAGARDTMAMLGFQAIYNMSGGITEWESSGYPVVR